MIFDTLKNADRYASLHPRFEEAFAFIQTAVSASYPTGTYEIDGKALYASVQEYETKPAKDGIFEGHESYIDIQYLISGIERIDMADRLGMRISEPYDAECDVAFYENTDKATMAVLEAGAYGIFFPDDIHKPGLAFDGKPVKVRKIVVKIQV